MIGKTGGQWTVLQERDAGISRKMLMGVAAGDDRKTSEREGDKRVRRRSCAHRRAHIEGDRNYGKVGDQNPENLVKRRTLGKNGKDLGPMKRERG